jgi:hypothetical protein
MKYIRKTPLLIATVYTQVGKTSPLLLATLKSFPLLGKERDVRNGQGEVFQDFWVIR